MKPTLETYGYMRISLTKDGKPKKLRVHRIVAEAFVDNPDPGNFIYVNHKDGDKTNNRADNLEWCDCSYNIRYNTEVLHKPPKVSVRVAVAQFDGDLNLIATYPSIGAASRATGVHHQSISWVVNKEHFYRKAGGYIWMKQKEAKERGLI